MCAIIGALGKNLPSQEQFIKARDTMTHRGPDDAGVYYAPEEGIALGHRRLSIIDLSSEGRQPLFSHDGRYAIVFNGEIYNYKELKQELKNHYPFKTQTDTEVLLAAYSTWGAKCLSKLNGMFAFAIWDKNKRELFCARDRLGVKPFYYTTQGGNFYFSSEIKGLLALGVPRAPNESVIFDYLYYGLYDHGEETFFEGIKQLRGGHYAIFQNGTLSKTQYWTLKNVSPQNEPFKKENVHEEFRALLKDSIRLRFRSDVPVGITLSSGLDSGSLLYYAEEILHRDIPTFSMCYQSEEYNECSLLKKRLTLRQQKAWHTITPEPKNILHEALAMNKTQDQPFGGMPTIAMAHVYKLAHDNDVTVLLSGQALDELLAGYRYYRLAYEKDTRGKPVSYARAYAPAHQDMSSVAGTDIVSNDFMDTYKKEVVFEKPFTSHLLNEQYRDIVYSKLPRALRFNDHISMAFGRELRLPYLDYRIVEFCFSLPTRYKMDGMSQKILIRDIMESQLPRVMKNTQKKAFSAAQNEWLRALYKQAVYDIMNSHSFQKRSYWNHDVLLKKIDAFFNGEGDNSFFIWQCINLELWFREFID